MPIDEAIEHRPLKQVRPRKCLVSQIAEREQNSDLTLELAQPVAGVAVSGREFPNLPNVVVEVLTGASPSGVRMIRTHTRQTHSTPWVLSGGQFLTFDVDFRRGNGAIVKAVKPRWSEARFLPPVPGAVRGCC